MGEIKSTLDIVMEKTKHLTLSDEEKRTQVQADVKNSVKGLVQKYQDMILREAQLEKEMAALSGTFDVNVGQIVFDEIFQRLDLNQDNGSLLGLLNGLMGIDTAGLVSLFAAYRDEIQDQTRTGMTDKKNTLAERHFISGSAVVPHLSADSSWRKAVQEIHKRYEAMLAGKKSDLEKLKIKYS